MKPAPFQYFRPDSVEQACRMLREQGDDAKILAGGQSLVATMNFRLARPTCLIDMGAIDGLDQLSPTSDGGVHIGARCRHIDLERNTLDNQYRDVLSLTAKNVGHLPIRTRGTIGGSLAHADPAAEWCILATALDAVMTVQGPDGIRDMPASEFFQGTFTTALGYDEILTAVTLPPLTERSGFGIAEFARRAGDFAIVAAVAVVAFAEDQTVSEARLALGGVSDRAVRATAAEEYLVGNALDSTSTTQAGILAAEAVTPTPDIHGSTQYRQDLVRAMVRRALNTANL